MTLDVYDWPTWARRAFLLTFPISVPAWLAVYVVCVLVVVIVCTIALATITVGRVLPAVAAPFAWALAAIKDLWSDDQ